MIRAVCTSDREFRDGYNDVMKSPMYDDQLLQQESSLDLDEIQKYNDAKKKEREEIERKKREKEEAEKPRYCMWKTFFFTARSCRTEIHETYSSLLIHEEFMVWVDVC